jgi:hypothetical protein
MLNDPSIDKWTPQRLRGAGAVVTLTPATRSGDNPSGSRVDPHEPAHNRMRRAKANGSPNWRAKVVKRSDHAP